MKLLAIESATPASSVALRDGAEVRAMAVVAERARQYRDLAVADRAASGEIDEATDERFDGHRREVLSALL